ncbi:MAG: type II toxin-antitoxin system VapC family toxin [Bifidobacteriaceae bacterium]|jgi:predicted nucleic acid-binding protein|nr:type II toxin-antitoxin system VapC family toxin [Bifidobacteriaceae bacterium]
MLVLDASVAAAWIIDDEATDLTDELLVRARQETALVPALFRFETANLVVAAERRGRMTQAQASQALDLLAGDWIRLADAGSGPSRWLELSRRHQSINLSAYDAAYLATAITAAVPLATLDARLRHAASAEGVAVLPA